jgi:16S rRNA (guanine(966)-N(2))-methyltransferase RsmD
MRIIGGKNKGLVLRPPQGLPVRPTTDMAKESLFNILENRTGITNLKILDLFAGTGNISLECCSRGALEVTAVDLHPKCVSYINSQKKELGYSQLEVVRKDVFSFLKQTDKVYDLIFADPPYDLPGISTIAIFVAERELLTEKGCLIIEHNRQLNLKTVATFAGERIYGQSVFSFFNPAL